LKKKTGIILTQCCWKIWPSLWMILMEFQW